MLGSVNESVVPYICHLCEKDEFDDLFRNRSPGVQTSKSHDCQNVPVDKSDNAVP